MTAGAPRTSRAPLDPRLVREVHAARTQVLLTTVLGVVQAGAIIATALLLARLGALLLIEREAPTQYPWLLVGLALAFLIRAVAVLVEQRTAHRAATAAIAELRSRVIAHAAALGPRASAGRGVDITAIATTGVEKLRPYLVGYVPQLLLSATVAPLCILTIAFLDPTSAIITIITLPLIPMFMILIGLLTQGRSERLLDQMRHLWDSMVDLVEGLPTLKALGREKGPEKVIREVGKRHHAATMGSLKYAFLSSSALEFLATLSVALVAVTIGMRLVYGHMELAPALAVLVLAPEVYLPLRKVGVQYHASTDGLAAVSACFAVLSEPLPADGSRPCPDLRHASIRLEDVSVASRDGWAPHECSLLVRPGAVTAITGPSGSGKTTAVLVMLGLLDPDHGSVRVCPVDPHDLDGGSGAPHTDTDSGGAHADLAGESDHAPEGIDLTEIDRRSLWDQITYLPQRPVLPMGSLREVLQEAAPDASDADLSQAAQSVGLTPVIAERGWDAQVGRGGVGLSLGERQRLALARALLSDAALVVLDEPTAHLDGSTEQTVIDVIERLRDHGRTVVVVAHRTRLVDVADHVHSVQAQHELVEVAP